MLRTAAWLTLTPSFLAAGCSGTEDLPAVSSAPAQFSASFIVPEQGRVWLDYESERSFTVTPDFGPGSTIAQNGEIYFHVAPSITSAGRARLLWVGTLVPLANEAPRGRPSINDAGLPKSQVEAWKLDVPVFRTTPPRAERSSKTQSRAPQPEGDCWVASIPALARAQLAVGVQMRDGMDMTLCGNVVSRLIATWSDSLTASGFAVLAHATGVKLAGPIEPLTRAIAIPDGLEIEDFRLPQV